MEWQADKEITRTAEGPQRGDVNVGDLARYVRSDRVRRVRISGYVVGIVDALHSPSPRGDGISGVKRSLETEGRNKKHSGISRSWARVASSISRPIVKSAHEHATYTFLVMEFIHAIRRPTIPTRDYYDCGRL